jgi:hypothetical protein
MNRKVLQRWIKDCSEMVQRVRDGSEMSSEMDGSKIAQRSFTDVLKMIERWFKDGSQTF